MKLNATVSDVQLAIGTEISLTDDITKYDEAHFYLYAAVGGPLPGNRLFEAISIKEYNVANKGKDNNFIVAGLYYDATYYGSVSFYISADGRKLIVKETSMKGYTKLMGIRCYGVMA